MREYRPNFKTFTFIPVQFYQMASRIQQIIVLIVLTGCSEIAFRESQPRGIRPLSEVPNAITGRYFLEDETDTLIILQEGYRIGYVNEQERLKAPALEAGVSDSLIIKYYKNYYFINTKKGNYWYLRLLKKRADGNLAFSQLENIPDEQSLKISYFDKLSALTPVDSVSGTSTTYLINPTPSKLMKIVGGGFFSEQVFKKIE